MEESITAFDASDNIPQLLFFNEIISGLAEELSFELEQNSLCQTFEDILPRASCTSSKKRDLPLEPDPIRK